MTQGGPAISWNDEQQTLAFRVVHRGASLPCYMHGLDFLRAFKVMSLTEEPVRLAFRAHWDQIEAAALAKADAGGFEAEVGQSERFISITARDL
jgi:hypothetical protein